jgi:hypothetical protein
MDVQLHLGGEAGFQRPPLKTIRTMVDVIFKEMSPNFESLYSETGRPINSSAPFYFRCFIPSAVSASS